MHDERLAQAENLLRDAMSMVGDLLNHWPAHELHVPPETLRAAVDAWLRAGERVPPA